MSSSASIKDLADGVGDLVSDELCVARQPIFDAERNVVAHELLFRFGESNAFFHIDGTVASASIISATLQSMWADELTGCKPVFINATRDLIVNDYFQLMPPTGTVVEILEDVEPNAELCQACSRLKQRGYRIAIDDVVGLERYKELLPLVDIIKIDFMDTDQATRATIVEQVPEGVELLAEKLETPQEFREAQKLGCTLFQGYVLSRPSVVRRKKLPSSKAHCLRALECTQRPDAQVSDLEEVVRQDLSLSVQLLRYLNSSFFPWSNVSSVRHGLVLLGLGPARRWVSITALAGMVGTGPDEPLRRALVRARHAELVTSGIGLTRLQETAFLTGMLSTLDVLLGMDFADVFDQLSVESTIQNTIIGDGTELRSVFDYITAFEAAKWQKCQSVEQELGLAPNEGAKLYRNALKYCEDVFS